MFADFDNFFEEYTLGLVLTSGTVTIKKDANNLLGISIGGGAPNCPCLYIVQIYDCTTVQENGVLEAGDEITSICGQLVKGKSKNDVAAIIQNASENVQIGYNKLHADLSHGKSFDLILKKFKHRLIEKMNSETADALGLSRAILSNDFLVKQFKDLERNETIFQNLIEFLKTATKQNTCIAKGMRDMYEVFSEIATKEVQERASEIFRLFAEQHKNMEKYQQQFLADLKKIIIDTETHLKKAIPDLKLTIKKYADRKFEYLSYCLKIKEMDDEEELFLNMDEPLFRVETGNYEYRLILRCRQLSRAKFASLRNDVQIKFQLLDRKHSETLAKIFCALMAASKQMWKEISNLTDRHSPLFPIEIDLATNAFEYNSIRIPQTSQYKDSDRCDSFRSNTTSTETGDETVSLLNEMNI